MFGGGPGSLPTDGTMIGLSQKDTRRLMEESLDIVMRLFRGDEPVSFRNDRWDLHDARLHLRPYSNPLFDCAVAAVASPTGAKLAGKHGIGLLSIGATTAAGFDALALHWNVLEEQARAHGHAVDRSKWRLVGMVHCAETQEQALRDVEYGIEHWFTYFQEVAAFPQMAVPGSNVKEMISFVNDSGFGAIGTPDMCIAQIERLMAQSNGGFGAYLMMAHNWANPQATLRSYELVARHVMPRFQGHHQATMDAAHRAREARPDLAAVHAQAVEDARVRYEQAKARR
jgi:limonene 1,2-monooxygenase